MSDNDTHETNENYTSTPPRVENEEEIDVDGNGPIVQYQSPTQVIPDRHKMVEILTPDEEKENMEDGEGSKRKTEPSEELSTPAAKRMRGEYEYTPHRDMYSEEFVRSSEENSTLQRVNSKLRELGKLAEANKEANQEGIKWMNTCGLAIENIQTKMVDSDKYHQRKFLELNNMISGMWRTVVDVKEKVEKIENKHGEVKNDTYKIKTLIKDTRRIITENRRESTSHSRAPSPVSQPHSPSVGRQQGPGASVVRLQGFRSPSPTQDSHHQAQVHNEVSSQDVEYPNCLFCDSTQHLPENCNVVGHWRDRRNIVFQKMRCSQCLGPDHKDGDVCIHKDDRCIGCGFKYFQDLNAKECKHHVSLCDTRKGNHGTQLHRKENESNGPARGGGQKKGGRGARGRGTN